MTRRVAVCLAVVLLFRGVAAAENLVSGPQVGDGVPGEFRVLFLNGDHAGEKCCPVSVKGYNLTSLIFANEVSDPLIALIKRMDRRLDEAFIRSPGKEKRGVFVVFTSDDARLKERLKDLIAKEKLRQVVICFGMSDGLDKYEIAAESELTVVLYANKLVKANFALRKGEISTDWADAIVKALSEVLPKE